MELELGVIFDEYFPYSWVVHKLFEGLRINKKKNVYDMEHFFTVICKNNHEYL
jgi:hypothetical protein